MMAQGNTESWRGKGPLLSQASQANRRVHRQVHWRSHRRRGGQVAAAGHQVFPIALYFTG